MEKILQVLVYDKKEKDLLSIKDSSYVTDVIARVTESEPDIVKFLIKGTDKGMVSLLRKLYGENLNIKNKNHLTEDNVEALYALSLGYIFTNYVASHDEIYDIEMPNALREKDRIIEFANSYGIDVALSKDFATKRLSSYDKKVKYECIYKGYEGAENTDVSWQA